LIDFPPWLNLRKPDSFQELDSSTDGVGRYRILLDGEWLFNEFSELPHLYVQVYGFFAEVHGLVQEQALIARSGDSPADDEYRRFNYPWAGGWSSANFYSSLVRNLADESAPRIIQIQFASPGFIELSVLLAAAAAVRRCINETAKTASIVNKTYDEIYRDLLGRRMLAFDVRKKQLELDKQELAFLIDSRKKLGTAIGLTPEQAKAVIQLSPGTADKRSAENELGTVKVLLSLVRRIIGLSKFEENGRAKFDG
jgi:hypothetical protein